ncbi:hypothetical protein BC628DRAFT_747864 [Trametes gibbosa]|nr:hypothetical protein BC628DRAFT_747864 [Trametes gibbosa]
MPLQFNGFSAHISCDDTELEIFAACNKEEDKTATGWIASEVSKEFRVHWASSVPMNVDIYVDGRCAQSICHRTTGTGYCPGVYISGASVRPFRFSDLVITDDDTVVDTQNVSDKLGSIEVAMTRVGGFVESTDPYCGRNFIDTGPIHEKSKKAGVHAVTLGETAVIKPLVLYRPFGKEKDPCVHFVFRYRPIELLRANGIAPPANPPSAQKGATSDQLTVKSEATSDDEDDDDEGALEEQLALLQSRLAKQRAKKAKTIVKRETSPIRLPLDFNNEVIDLT